VNGKKSYVPDRGDIVWLSFDPQAGHEQAGKHPALVISPAIYNSRAILAVVCPITSHIKGYPFEVEIPAGLKVGGAILTDHLKSLDWKALKAELICHIPEEILSDCQAKIRVLIGIN
jgi:mRNA interferase MazF